MLAVEIAPQLDRVSFKTGARAEPELELEPAASYGHAFEASEVVESQPKTEKSTLQAKGNASGRRSAVKTKSFTDRLLDAEPDVGRPPSILRWETTVMNNGQPNESHGSVTKVNGRGVAKKASRRKSLDMIMSDFTNWIGRRKSTEESPSLRPSRSELSDGKSVASTKGSRIRRSSMLDTAESLTGDKSNHSRKSRRASSMGFGHTRRQSSLGVSEFSRRSSKALTTEASERSFSVKMSRLDTFGPAGPPPVGARRRRSEMVPSSHTSGRRRSVIMDALEMTRASSKLISRILGKEENGDGEYNEGDEPWFTSLDEFKPLTKLLHGGRICSIWLAQEINREDNFVVKRYEKSKLSLQDERCVRRAQAFASSLEHRAITKVFGLWETEEAMYIVEEYASGGDVLVAAMTYPEKYTEAFVAKNVIKPLLEALVYLHGNGIIHRSIFPENLLLQKDDSVRLTGFINAIDSRLDVPNEKINFVDYCAPEVLSLRFEGAPQDISQLFDNSDEGEGITTDNSLPTNPWEWQEMYDEKADIWQVGCLTHEVLCNVLPFEVEDLMLTGALILWADLERFPCKLSAEAGSFMLAALTKDPRQRPSADELLKHPWITRHAAGEILPPDPNNQEPEEEIITAATAVAAAVAAPSKASEQGSSSWWGRWHRRQLWRSSAVGPEPAVGAAKTGNTPTSTDLAIEIGDKGQGGGACQGSGGVGKRSLAWLVKQR